MKFTSPCVLGIIVAFAIFSSMRSRIPVLSSDALINIPELWERGKSKSHSNCNFMSKPKEAANFYQIVLTTDQRNIKQMT